MLVVVLLIFSLMFSCSFLIALHRRYFVPCQGFAFQATKAKEESRGNINILWKGRKTFTHTANIRLAYQVPGTVISSAGPRVFTHAGTAGILQRYFCGF